MVGRILGHYRMLEKIGAGGSGEVYRAEDLHLNRDVAIKILPAGTLADETLRRRFRKEAEALSKVNHPNIQTVHDFDSHEGVDFLVVEFVPGPTLADKLGFGTLTEKEVVAVGAQIAAALEEAHERRVVHRDLKPSNIKVTPKGHVKVFDFGLAKSLRPLEASADTESLTEAPAVMGTLPYMAPEQLRGEEADTRMDIWALGAVLYELATGRRPFEARLPTALAADIQHKPIVPPRQLNPHLSSRLEEVILKCLEKEPENRYQSAKELGVDLRRLAAPTSELRPVASPQIPARWKRTGWILIVSAPVILLAAILIRWNVFSPREGRLGTATAPRIQRLAVLPLTNLSGDPQKDFLADGMTEALITDLSKIRALHVISRTSVVQYKGTKKTAPQIAGELHVDGIVEGSVQLSGDRVKVTVQLIDARSDRHLWAQSYERDAKDFFALEREVARAIVSEIRVQLTPQEHARLTAVRQTDPQAHEAYTKGLILSKGTGEQRKKAREYFEQAVRIDPDYAPAYAGLANSYWTALDMRAEEGMPKAKEFARKALAIDNNLARAHTALAAVLFYGDWNWVEAEKEFRRALELGPGDSEAHRFLSLLLLAMGRFEEALTHIRAAQELDPHSVVTSTAAGWAYYSARQYEEGAEQCRNALEIAPNSDSAHACLSYCYLGSGKLKEAIAESEKAFTLSGGDAVRAVWLGRAYALAGREKEAREVLNGLLRSSKQSYVPPYFLATLYMALGDREQAFSWLVKAYSQRDLYLVRLKVDSAFDSARSDPRFQDLLRRMNLAP